MTNARSSSMIRPAWTPLTIAMMVLGFMIFWPLGLAMLVYILWGDRLDELKTEVNRATDNVASSFKFGNSQRTHYSQPNGGSASGNAAFDDWREVEMARLEEERRKLDEMRQEFDEFLSELRRAKDAEAFEKFMASKKPGSSSFES